MATKKYLATEKAAEQTGRYISGWTKQQTKNIEDQTEALKKQAEALSKVRKEAALAVNNSGIFMSGGMMSLADDPFALQNPIYTPSPVGQGVTAPFNPYLDGTTFKDITDQNFEDQNRILAEQLQGQQKTANNVLMIGNMITTAIQGGGSPGQMVGSILGGLGPLLTAINPVLGAAVSVGGSLITTISGQQLQTVQNRGNYQSGILYG